MEHIKNKKKLEALCGSLGVSTVMVRPYWWILKREGFTPIEVMYPFPTINEGSGWDSMTMQKVINRIRKHFK